MATSAVALPLALAEAGGPNDPDGPGSRASHAKEFVHNRSFEKGTAGWRASTPDQTLRTRGVHVTGKTSVFLQSSMRVGRVVVTDIVDTVPDTVLGQTYLTSGYVRSVGSPIRGNLRIREFADDGSVVDVARAKFVAQTETWTKVELTYTAVTEGGSLDLSVIGRNVPVGHGLLVDNLSLRKTQTPTPPPTQGPAGCVSDPMGIPPSGSTYLGAAVSGTSGTVESRETELGDTLALHRTYFTGNSIDAAVRQANEDLAKGRLPWISFKAPYSWAEMANGAGDAWATQLADGLATVPGPVWLAVHHEPETDGDLAQWTQMQQRVAPIIHARTDNVAYSIIHTGWLMYGGGTDEVSKTWPGDQHVDILGVDAYNDYGAMRNGREGTKVLEMRTYYEKMAAWANAHGTAWAIGETGQTRKASAIDPTWLDRAFHDMEELGGAGLAYFDSSANSVADWTLDDPVKLARFKALLAESVRLC